MGWPIAPVPGGPAGAPSGERGGGARLTLTSSVFQWFSSSSSPPPFSFPPSARPTLCCNACRTPTPAGVWGVGLFINCLDHTWRPCLVGGTAAARAEAVPRGVTSSAVSRWRQSQERCRGRGAGGGENWSGAPPHPPRTTWWALHLGGRGADRPNLNGEHLQSPYRPSPRKPCRTPPQPPVHSGIRTRPPAATDTVERRRPTFCDGSCGLRQASPSPSLYHTLAPIDRRCGGRSLSQRPPPSPLSTTPSFVPAHPPPAPSGTTRTAELFFLRDSQWPPCGHPWPAPPPGSSGFPRQAAACGRRRCPLPRRGVPPAVPLGPFSLAAPPPSPSQSQAL